MAFKEKETEFGAFYKYLSCDYFIVVWDTCQYECGYKYKIVKGNSILQNFDILGHFIKVFFKVIRTFYQRILIGQTTRSWSIFLVSRNKELQ